MAIIVKNYDDKSSTVLNAIKTTASQFYQDRIDTATQDNLALVESQIYKYEATRNEYYMAIDKIALTDVDNMEFENELARLKKAAFTYGKDTESLWINLIKAQNYNASTAAADLFKRFKPEILSVYHTLNRTDVYPLTIDYEIYTRMFTSEAGFGDMMGSMLQVLETSNQVDEFLMFKNLIHGNIVEGKVGTVVVSPIIDKQSANDFVIAVKKQSDLWKFPTDVYNYAGVSNTCPKARQVLILGSAIKSLIDVEVLAVAYNLEKVAYDTVQIDVDNFGALGDDVYAMLVDERWFNVRDKLQITNEVENQIGLYRNKFKHVHQLFGALPFYNATVFTKATPTLVSIDLRPDAVTISKGQGRAFVVEAVGTNNPPAKCTFEHNGTDPDTYITTTGFLYVGVGETTTPITVTATSTFDVLITDTATVTVV